MIFTSSCCVYYPQSTDIPLIKQKNDLRIDAGVSLIPSINTSVSYGISNRFAIQAFGSVGTDRSKYFQLAPGMYKNFPNKFVTELYTGFGAGYGDAYRDAIPGRLYGNFELYFLQLDFGRNDCRFLNMDYGFGIKSGCFHSKLTDRNYHEFYSMNGPFDILDDYSMLIEPMAIVRFGWKNFKFNIKAEACTILRITNPDRYIPTQPFNIGLGLNYFFNTKN